MLWLERFSTPQPCCLEAQPLSYPFVMALVEVVHSLHHLREVFDAAPKGTCGGCTEWMPVQLTGLVLRSNAHSTTATHHWACVQVSSLVVDGRTYSLSAGLDAHVTIGSWKKTGDDSTGIATSIELEIGWRKMHQC